MQTVLILQGGGALGAFECGVVKTLEEEQIFPDVIAGVCRSRCLHVVGGSAKPARRKAWCAIASISFP
jgi:hypothetical protein